MNRKLLGCLAASFFFHILALCFFQTYSLWFSSLPKHIYSDTAMEKKERDEILKESFRAAETQLIAKAAPQKELKTEAPMIVPLDKLISCTFNAPFPEQQLVVDNENLLHFVMPQPDSYNFLESLPKELILPAAESKPMAFLPIPAESTLPPSIDAPLAHIPFSSSIEPIPFEGNQAPIKIPNPLTFNALPKIPSLEELETSSYSEAFDTELVFIPHGETYLFALTLLPKEDLHLPKIRQHFTFLIDRSNSIQQERLSYTKTAVVKALEELSSEDTFNIIAFDNKIEKFSPGSVPLTTETFARAETFLENIHLGSFFSSGDPSKPLFLTVPGTVQSDEIHTAILLTDGEAFAKKGSQRSILNDWTGYNRGKVALFPLGMDTDSQLGLLDVAAVFNKGKATCSNSKRGLKRKLMKLMKTIGTPVAKNINCQAISRSPNATITLFPKSGIAPHLYLDQPYIILGETSNLDDFIIFVQGRLKDKWLNIRKTVSFLSAKKASKSLEAEWAQHQAFFLYDRYMKDDNSKHLAEARHLLEPFNIEVSLK